MKLKLNSTEINALANEELALFTNSFSYHSDDYFHQNIGSLFGIIQVSDHSKNSEYLPNLLTSILKKAFYSNAHKSAERNLEVGLKKMNLALADLAEHDIVEWNNNLHAIIGVVHGDKLLFTQVGNALISIGRNNKLMYLSETPIPATHPIKTFKDIIIGKIKPNDKIIISSPTMIDIFKFDDLSRLYKTFSSKEFDDILFKTLEKEGENISAIVINIKKERTKKYSEEKTLNNDKNVPIERLTKNKNFLGSEVQRKKKDKETKAKKENIKTESVQKKPTIEDKKNISSELSIPKEKTKTLSKKQSLDMAQAIAETKEKRKNKIKKKKEKVVAIEKTEPILPKKEAIEKITPPKSTVKKPSRKLNDLKDTKKNTPTEISPFEEMKEIYLKDDDLAKKAKKPSTKKLKSFFRKGSPTKKSPVKNTQTKKEDIQEVAMVENSTVNKSNKFTTIKSAKKELSSSQIATHEKRNTYTSKKINLSLYLNEYLDNLKFFSKKFSNIATGTLQKIISRKKTSLDNKSSNSQTITQSTTTPFNNLPSLISKLKIIIKEIIKRIKPLIGKHKKIILIILFIILVPTIIGLLSKSKKDTKSLEKLVIPPTLNTKIDEVTVKDKNTTRKISLLSAPVNILTDNDEIILVQTKDNQLYEVDKKNNTLTKIDIPENIKLTDIKAIDYIKSLNLFFVSSNTGVVSYSPKTKKFIINKINLPTNFQLAGQSTYLSYLYLLDDSSRQIYRYPRATGGFASSKRWLKEPLKHKEIISGMAIDEDVRIAYLDGVVEKYSKGILVNTQQFNLKSLDFINTNRELRSYYLLSKKEGKILRINKSTNKIEKEYQNTAIQNTTTFTVDEKGKLIYLSNGKEILSIDL